MSQNVDFLMILRPQKMCSELAVLKLLYHVLQVFDCDWSDLLRVVGLRYLFRPTRFQGLKLALVQIADGEDEKPLAWSAPPSVPAVAGIRRGKSKFPIQILWFVYSWYFFLKPLIPHLA